MPASKKYPDEVRERAVRMVFETREESGQQQGVIVSECLDWTLIWNRGIVGICSVS
jgi:transposase-like protein